MADERIKPIDEEIALLEGTVRLYENLDDYRDRCRRIYRYVPISRIDAAKEVGLSHTGLQNFDSGETEPDPDKVLSIVGFIKKYEELIESSPHIQERAKRLGYDKRKLEDFNEGARAALAEG